MQASSHPGLQVQNLSGQWIDAPPVPGTFVVNIGKGTSNTYNLATNRIVLHFVHIILTFHFISQPSSSSHKGSHVRPPIVWYCPRKAQRHGILCRSSRTSAWTSNSRIISSSVSGPKPIHYPSASDCRVVFVHSPTGDPEIERRPWHRRRH